jgi:hypothetical protein
LRPSVFQQLLLASPIAAAARLVYDGNAYAYSTLPPSSLAGWPVTATVLSPALAAADRGGLSEAEFLAEAGVTITVTPSPDPVPLNHLAKFVAAMRAYEARSSSGDGVGGPDAAGEEFELGNEANVAAAALAAATRRGGSVAGPRRDANAMPSIPIHVLRAINAYVRSSLALQSSPAFGGGGGGVSVPRPLAQRVPVAQVDLTHSFLSDSSGGGVPAAASPLTGPGAFAFSTPFIAPKFVNIVDIGTGCTAHTGLYLAARVTSAGVVVAADTKTLLFSRPVPLREFILSVSATLLDGSDTSKSALAQLVSGLRVTTTHRAVREYTLTGVGAPPAAVMLSMGAGKPAVSLAQFFDRKFHVSLTAPATTPTVCAGESVTLPLDVCAVLPNQIHRATLKLQSKALLREVSCLPALQRHRLVESAVSLLGADIAAANAAAAAAAAAAASGGADPTAAAAAASTAGSVWDPSVIMPTPTLLTVTGRVLPPPTIFTAPYTGAVRSVPAAVAERTLRAAEKRLAPAPGVLEAAENKAKRGAAAGAAAAAAGDGAGASDGDDDGGDESSDSNDDASQQKKQPKQQLQEKGRKKAKKLRAGVLDADSATQLTGGADAAEAAMRAKAASAAAAQRLRAAQARVSAAAVNAVHEAALPLAAAHSVLQQRFACGLAAAAAADAAAATIATTPGTGKGKKKQQQKGSKTAMVDTDTDSGDDDDATASAGDAIATASSAGDPYRLLVEPPAVTSFAGGRCCDPTPPLVPNVYRHQTVIDQRGRVTCAHDPLILPAEAGAGTGAAMSVVAGPEGSARVAADAVTGARTLLPAGAAVCTETVPVLGTWPTRARRVRDPRAILAPVIIVNIAVKIDLVYGFFSQLMSAAAELGVSIAPLRQVVMAENPIVAEQRLDALFARNDQRPDAVFAVCARSSRDTLYSAVKRLCLTKYGCISQGVAGAKLLDITRTGDDGSFVDRRSPIDAARSNVVNEGSWVYHYFANMVLKLNTKLGGVNFQPAPPAALAVPSLVLGMDADHPVRAGRRRTGNDTALAYSFACVIGSRDLASTRYAGIAQQQGIDREVMPPEHMAFAVRRHVTQFLKETGRIPERILMFRDGAADGLRPLVMSNEVVAIKQACRSIDPDYDPKLLFVICTKRHKTRFWPADASAGAGTGASATSKGKKAHLADPEVVKALRRAPAGGDATAGGDNTTTTTNNNGSSDREDETKSAGSGVHAGASTGAAAGGGFGVGLDHPSCFATHPVMHAPVPGTVVDDPAMTRVGGSDFFMLSHCAHRGTPVPVLYQVVVNEEGLSADVIQELTYYLCHTAQRVARTSNVPAVALHAHSMCGKVKFLSKEYEAARLLSGAEHAPVTDTPGKPELWTDAVHPDLADKAFYM